MLVNVIKQGDFVATLIVSSKKELKEITNKKGNTVNYKKLDVVLIRSKHETTLIKKP